MPVLLAHFSLGILFGFGLLIAGMTDPAKVIAFLDIAAIAHGGWDPSLAFVMLTAIPITAAGYRYLCPRSKPVLDSGYHLPGRVTIDARLLTGAMLFGVGWGLVGLCPAPALVSLLNGDAKTIGFVVAMLLGMRLATWTASGSRSVAEKSRPAE